MDFIDEIQGYKVYRNKDGFLEGYRTKGAVDNNKQQSGSSVDKLVTQAKTIKEFAELLRKPVKLKPKQDKLPELF